jgi:hypothetical protein
VIARFRSYQAAFDYAKLYRESTQQITSIWYEILDLRWFENELNSLYHKQKGLSTQAYFAKLAGDQPRRQEIWRHISELERRSIKTLESARSFAASRRWLLDCSLIDGRIRLQVTQRPTSLKSLSLPVLPSRTLKVAGVEHVR